MRVIKTPRLTLRTLSAEDGLMEDYAGWLNDPEVNRYLKTQSATVESVRQFVKDCNEEPGTFLLGIFLANRHIGNIKLRRDGDIGIMIGERDCWGKGYAAEAIRALTAYAFEELGIERLIAGCHVENVGSARAFLNAGWSELREADRGPEWKAFEAKASEFQGVQQRNGLSGPAS